MSIRGLPDPARAWGRTDRRVHVHVRRRVADHLTLSHVPSASSMTSRHTPEYFASTATTPYRNVSWFKRRPHFTNCSIFSMSRRMKGNGFRSDSVVAPIEFEFDHDRVTRLMLRVVGSVIVMSGLNLDLGHRTMEPLRERPWHERPYRHSQQGHRDSRCERTWL